MAFKDGVKREPSIVPSIHRELPVVFPPLEGRDIANLQRAIKTRIDTRGIDVPTPVHGKWTHASAVAGVEAGYFLGALSITYLKTTKVGGQRRLLMTEGLQEMIRHPDSREDNQLVRAKDRQAQIDRGPRYYKELSDDILGPADKNGMEAALRWGKSQIGVTEKPPGANWGHPVQDWIKLCGYMGPVPWCGCFVNAVCVKGGIANGAGWIGYTPAIISHSRQGMGGWKWVGPASGQRGMLALFDTPGGDPAVHVGIVLRRISNMIYETLEGNTGSGSNADGGQVQVRQRSTQGNFRIVGFAVPPWK